MKDRIQLIGIILTSLLLTQCGWVFDKKEPKPALPAITQEGKQTFGCLVNGEIWRPSGFNGTLNLQPYYDLQVFNISCYRSKNDKIYQGITIYSDSLVSVGKYALYSINKQAAKFMDFETRCFYNEDSAHVNGTLTITRLDKQKRIIAGLFEFVIGQPDCDTIRVIDGRFDVRF